MYAGSRCRARSSSRSRRFTSPATLITASVPDTECPAAHTPRRASSRSTEKPPKADPSDTAPSGAAPSAAWPARGRSVRSGAERGRVDCPQPVGQHVGRQGRDLPGRGNVVQRRRDDGVPVGRRGEALGGGDEPGAQVGQVGTENLRGEDPRAVADSPGDHHDAVVALAYRPQERERVRPAGLPRPRP